MKLFVGLGNPGKEYEWTRHNMGFIALDKFAELANGSFDHSDFKGLYGIIKNPLFPEPILILKPQTFMNLSGTSVRPLADFYKLTPSDIVVVYDDMAIEEGAIRLRLNGSSGGHKGMQNIIDMFSNDQFRRIRVGIGEPPSKDSVNFVLGKPKGDSYDALNFATDNAAKALRDIAMDDSNFSKIMSKYNSIKRKGND
ncbi:MAG TPA: aminoacyl-tRNA hydrolase [Firmicutes bacterium]|nr:aminoacyl-tRNA hydrolase [Bacillota bacterium]